MALVESVENYLETILVIGNEKGEVRSIDIANRLGVSKPTVSHVVKQLREGGEIAVDERGYITLSDKGRATAERIYERHVVIASFFMKLGVGDKAAHEDACLVEHDISEETFEAIRRAEAEK